MYCPIYIRHLIDILSALLTPVIALLALYIASQQKKINRNKLKLDLFDKRIATFDHIKNFIKNIVVSDEVNIKDIRQFLDNTKRLRFLFGDDKNINKYADQLYDKATKLRNLQKAEKEDLKDGDKNCNLEKQKTIVEWLNKQNDEIDDIFMEHLVLRHY